MRYFILIFLWSNFGLLLGQSLNELDSAKKLIQEFKFEQASRLLEGKELSSAESKNTLAYSYLKLGQVQDAANTYLEALKLDSNNNTSLNNLASCYLKLGQVNKTIAIYQKLIDQNPDNPYYFKQIASTYDRENQLLKAIDNFQKAIELNQRDLSSASRLGELYLKIEQYELADSLLNSFLNKFPGTVSLLRTKLKVNYKNRQYAETIELAEQLFQQQDSLLMIQKIAGIAYFHEKKCQNAIKLIENVIEVDKKSEILHYYLALSYREIGDLKKATALLEKAIDLGVTENLSNYYTQLAVSYEEQKDYANSIQAYKVAYKSSKDKVLLYHLARNYDIYYKDKSIALNYYQRYLEEEDTANRFLQNYSKHRIEELKTAIHFGLDTLN